MKEQLDILNKKLEFQIENMMDTIIKIQELEKEHWPADHISDWHEISLSMCFYHILTRSVWDLMNTRSLSQKNRERYITEIWNMTHNHFKELYGWDSKKDITNQ